LIYINLTLRCVRYIGGSAPSHVSGFKVIPGRGIEGVIDNKRAVIGNRSFMYENGMTVAALQSLEHIVQQFENNGDTVVYMACDKTVKAIFVISDIVRAEASEAIDRLKKENLKVSLISGDNKATTNSIASQVGIEDVISEASPIMEKDIIHALQQKGKKVMMAGDGINDAPSLTEASLGVAMGRGTDIAMESADAVLVRNDLRLIPYLVRISRKTYAIIKQNVFWAFFYNIVAITLAVAGGLHPIIAAGAMAASSLIVVINSLRITRIGQRYGKIFLTRMILI
ncbi:MAG: HAD-IC family P-type ATPase, partial [Thermodesulfovibrionales bacterium]|nr:HAD-IC family P-type ATPase [Thermodesulfovibrionales bacterium]